VGVLQMEESLEVGTGELISTDRDVVIQKCQRPL